MGDHADDLIEAGMMQEGFCCMPRGRYYPTYTVNRKPVKIPAPDTPEAPRVSLDDFKSWYKSEDWKGCCTFEVAGIAWEEATKRMLNTPYGKTVYVGDVFTEWHDFEVDRDLYRVLSTYAMCMMAWNEAVRRLT